MNQLLQKFREDGFLVLENFNSAAACDELMKHAEELSAQCQPDSHPSVFQTSDQSRTTDDYFLNSGGNISFFFEKDAFDANGKLKGNLFHSLNKIGHAMHDLDPVYNRFSRSPQLQQLSSDLGMKDAVLIQSMHIFKHARIGGVVDVHQDSTFLYTEPESCIGFWFALEDATKENGCLWAKPGGHKTSLRSWFRRKKEGGTEMHILDPEPYSMEGMQALEVRKGACVVLHGLLPHYSLPNTSGKSRQAYAIHTVDKNAAYPEANWLHRNMDELKGFF